jgi:hypothetical protein
VWHVGLLLRPISFEVLIGSPPFWLHTHARKEIRHFKTG